MRTPIGMRWAIMLLGAALGVWPAAADVTGSYDGNVTAKKLPQAIAVAAVFSQAGTAVNGTVALPGDLAVGGGEYVVVGKATPKRLKVTGGGPGGTFRWRAKIVGDTLRGKAKVKAQGGRVAGLLAMTRNAPFAIDGSACDAVYTANQTTFDDQVLDQALAVCTTCHAPGLQAGSTRLHVDRNDPLATARNVALFVDADAPSSSRILEKPMNLVPHGGGVRLEPGSAGAQILESWVALVAQAHCN